jgi:hypothetical protein
MLVLDEGHINGVCTRWIFADDVASLANIFYFFYKWKIFITGCRQSVTYRTGINMQDLLGLTSDISPSEHITIRRRFPVFFYIWSYYVLVPIQFVVPSSPSSL